MIRVEPQPEPSGFDAAVRQKGLTALSDKKAGRIAKLPDHWRACLPDLRTAYGDVCAYAAIYIDPVTGGDSVEHFAPKSTDEDLAYEWSNYRLVCRLMNSRKSAFRDVLDPFAVADGWFILNLTTMGIEPSAELSEPERTAVVNTIGRLKLDDKKCRQARANYYDLYLKGYLSFAGLRHLSPFVAAEVERQGLKRPE